MFCFSSSSTPPPSSSQEQPFGGSLPALANSINGLCSRKLTWAQVYLFYYLGVLFLLLVIVQHIGGMTAFLGKKPNPQHRSFGKLLVVIGRVIAGVGWILGGNQKNAIIVAIISIILLGLSMVLETNSTGSIKKQESGEGSRSKSPRAKREWLFIVKYLIYHQFSNLFTIYRHYFIKQSKLGLIPTIE